MISLSRKKWLFKDNDELAILNICQKFSISEMIARIIHSRNIPFEQIQSFLNPRLKDLLPDPLILKDMEPAIQRVITAIQNHEKITIYGDYDVDGATSVSQLVLYFRMLGINVSYYIPDRIEEGYGVNSGAIRHLHQEGSKLIIMVDCGTTSIEQIELANTLGIDSIILDHHAVGIKLPPAIAVVNPHRVDQLDAQDIKELCAAGVVFLFLVGLQRALRQISFFQQNMPELMHFCDLVALGTVCDVMPISGLNRAFVKRGLEILQQRRNLGLEALIHISGLKEQISAYHFGFVLGPRINAGGRIGKSTLGTQLLTTQDPLIAQEIAQQLNILNEQRHHIEQQTFNEAIQQIENQKFDQHSVIIVSHADWHPGIVGIVASRLTEKYKRPCLVATIDHQWIKGSARSIEGVDIGDLFHKAIESGLLDQGGGHAMAGGFTIERSKLEVFRNFLCQQADAAVKSYCPTIAIDAQIALSGATPALLEEMELLEPFGVGNPAPRWYFNQVWVRNARIIGSNHIQCVLQDNKGTTVQAIAFKVVNSPLADALFNAQPLSVVGTLKKNTWNQNSAVQIIIEDIALSSENK